MNRVLIVEDTEPLSDLVREILVQSGYDVVGQAFNGSDSINMFIKLKPNLVIMDIMLPDISGIDAARRILEINDQISIIVITALSQRDIMEECMSVGCKAFLVKPFRLKELIDVVNSVNRSDQVCRTV